MKRIITVIVSMLILALTCTSCVSGLFNSNYELYGTEWSNEDNSEGLKFYNDDTVVYYYILGQRTGTFDYSSLSGYIEFSGLRVTFMGETAEFTSAEILEDGSMKVYWHKLGLSDNYFMFMYRRR